MINCLTGEILYKKPDEVTISCGGIGFQVFIPTSIYANLSDVGGVSTVFTYMNVREGAVELFGFLSDLQRSCFAMLLSVSGIGPRSALAILSLYETDKISLAIASGDYKAFTACSGIGPKIAQRVVLELKDKVKDLGVEQTEDIIAMNSYGSENTSEAIAALLSLGFSNSQAASAVAKMPSDLSVEELINQSLKMIGKNI